MNADAKLVLLRSISIVFHKDPILALMTLLNVQQELSLKTIIRCAWLALLDA